jgi:diacylglycerol kinase (ATP)
MKLWFPIALLGVLCFGGVLLFEGGIAKACSVFAGIDFFCLSAACLFGLPSLWLKRSDGTLNPLSYFFFLPLHLLNWMSFTLVTRISGERPADRVAENVWLGRRMTPQEAATLFGDAPVAVLDLTSEFQECARLMGARYLCLPTMDHSAPTQARLRAGVDFISANCRERSVYVHCALGHGRSSTVVAAWLLRNDPTLAVDAAIKQLKSIRSGVRLNVEQREALEKFVQDCRKTEKAQTVA